MKCILWCLKLYPDFIIHKLWQLDIKTSMQFNLDDISTMNETCKYTYIIFIYHTLFTHICLTNEFWIFLQHLTLFVICFGIDLFSLLCFCLLILFFYFFRKKKKKYIYIYIYGRVFFWVGKTHFFQMYIFRSLWIMMCLFKEVDMDTNLLRIEMRFRGIF